MHVMEQVRTEASGQSDREQREALDQVQMELRQARAALHRVGGGVAIAEAELQSAIDAAKQQRDEAQARLSSLEADEQRLRAEAHELDRQIEARKKEDALLAHGAELLAKYPDGIEPPKEMSPFARKLDDAMMTALVGSGTLLSLMWFLLWVSGRL